MRRVAMRHAPHAMRHAPCGHAPCSLQRQVAAAQPQRGVSSAPTDTQRAVRDPDGCSCSVTQVCSAYALPRAISFAHTCNHLCTCTCLTSTPVSAHFCMPSGE
eukprot:364693-Chlamydomonas_euryale.AAC.2